MHGHPHLRLELELTGWKNTSLLDFKHTGRLKIQYYIEPQGKKIDLLVIFRTIFSLHLKAHTVRHKPS